MQYYDYFRSSAAYRCRIAMNLKGLKPERKFVGLTNGDVQSDWYTKLNPQQLVPALVDDNLVLTQSMAIIEYLDETYPEPALLPNTSVGRVRVRALAQSIACDIHPLNNLRVLNYLTGEMGLDDDKKLEWYHHWITVGFDALEAKLSDDPETGTFCHEDTVGLADICLAPQVFNARRFDVDVSRYPTISRIDADINKLSAFVDARPENQPDAV